MDDPPVLDAPSLSVEARADSDDFEAFYRSRRDRIARALAITIGDSHLAAEATDEAMARAYQRWSSICSYDDPGAWVYRVGLNWATSAIRRRRRPPKELAAAADRAVDDMAEPEVMAALDELDANQRAVIVCRFYLGLSEAETASALGIRPGTAKSRLSRALTKLRSRLSHLDPDGIQ